MRRTVRDVRGLLSPLNPVPASGEARSGLPARAERDLDMICAEDTARTPPQRDDRRRRRRRSVVASGLAAGTVAAFVTVGAGILWPWSGGGRAAFAATPTPLRYQPEPGSAPRILRALADRVLQHPAGDGQKGAYRHVVLDRWSLNTRVKGTNVTSVVLPSHEELWLAPDGSAVTRIRYDRPRFTSAQQREAWERQGSPGRDSAAKISRYGPGEFARTWGDAGPPPTAPHQFATWLQTGHPPRNGPSETLTAWVDLAREFVPDAATRANLLRVGADLPGLVYDGRVTDRAGRHGMAFSITDDRNGLPTKHTIVIDPNTGSLLAHEDMLTTTPGKLNVKIPAVIDYDTFLVSEHTTIGPPN